MIFGQGKRDRAVAAEIGEFCNLISKTVESFRKMITEYIDWDSKFKEHSRQVHEMEHECDLKRRKIERAMFEGAFLPAYREEYITLLEKLDRVANKAEEAADTIYLMRPDIPEPVRQDFVTIANITVDCFAPIPEGVRNLLDGNTDIRELEEFVEVKEQEVDKIQFHVTRRLFKDLGIDKADALCLKMLIDDICSVSDRIENVTDQMAIVAIKRQL